MPISDKLIDQLLEGNTSPEDILGEDGLLRWLTKRVAERVLEAEMEQHLGHSKHDVAGNNTGNSRNGKSGKTVRSVHAESDLQVPRDRNGQFAPQRVKKDERQLNGFDERIISLYAKGMTTRDIQAHFMEVYGVEVSASFISQVTNGVMEEVKAWQNRPLESVYLIVYLDALVVRSRSSGGVENKSIYLVPGINREGEKELPGLWLAQTEGTRFRLSVMTERKSRRVQEIWLACSDGLKGFAQAIEAVYPHTRVQLCIVHQVRHSLRYVSWKQRKAVAADLRRIYSATTLTEAEQALAAFAERWDQEHPGISQSWRNHWERLSVFFDYPPQIRKVIYTTNAIESLNASLRKVTRTRRSFPNDEAVMKVLYLALHEITRKRTMPIRDWKQAMSQFMILFGERASL